MRPLSSPVRENRILGLVELGVGFFFAIAAGVLDPIEAGVGVVVGTTIVGGVLSVVRLRASERAVDAAGPAPTEAREEPEVLPRRIAWPVALQVGVFLVLTAAARTPGMLAGIALGIGLALLLTSRWLERWEDAHKVSLLREPGNRRLYVARDRKNARPRVANAP
jgi:hypothetical protein